MKVYFSFILTGMTYGRNAARIDYTPIKGSTASYDMMFAQIYCDDFLFLTL